MEIGKGKRILGGNLPQCHLPQIPHDNWNRTLVAAVGSQGLTEHGRTLSSFLEQNYFFLIIKRITFSGLDCEAVACFIGTGQGCHVSDVQTQ
jgi:hypothetical protein